MDCSRPFHTVTQAGTIVTSPNYPNIYDNNHECGIRVQFESGERVVVEFRAFNVEHHSSCIWDFVEIRDGHNEKSSLIKQTLCGSAIHEPILSTDSSLFIRFKTDDELTHSGFKMRIDKGNPTIFYDVSTVISTLIAS